MDTSFTKRLLARVLAPFACAAFAGCAHQITPMFPQMPEIVAHDGVVRVSLSTVLDRHTLMPTFLFAGKTGGAPTLRVHPGDRIEIAYTNNLPADDVTGNMTNLHFHGLVTSPTAPGDDVLDMMAMPGQTLHYIVKIGRDQQPGLYWYHPHAHGNTFRQVGEGGMSGAIIVDGIARDRQALASMRERVLVVRDVADSLDVDRLRGHPELVPPSDENATNQPCRKTVGAHVTVNDVEEPQIAFAPHETQFFRLLNATASRFLDLSLPGATLRLVALDGVALDAYPGAKPLAAFEHIVVPPGARAEFTVGDAKAGTRLQAACFDSGPDGDADPSEVLATIVADPNAVATVPSAPDATAIAYAHPLAKPIPAPVRDRRVTFTETNTNGANLFKINGKSYEPSEAPMFVAKSGTIERWTIVNRTREVHAFHIHQVHFVVQSVDGKPQTRYWRDSFATPPGKDDANGNVVPTKTIVLVDFRDAIVRGTFLFHCHLLDHEDLGMMAAIAVK